MIGFIGTAQCKLDTKSRILVPAKFTKKLANKTLIINQWFDNSFVLFKEDEWMKFFQQPLDFTDLNQQNSRQTSQISYEMAEELSLDSNDRIMLPKILCEYAQLEKEVFLIGMGNRIVGWNPEMYEQQRKARDSQQIEDLRHRDTFSPQRMSDH